MIMDWLWSAIAAIGGIVIALLISGFFIASAFTLLAAKIVKVENATFGRAVLATFLGSLAEPLHSYLAYFSVPCSW